MRLRGHWYVVVCVSLAGVLVGGTPCFALAAPGNPPKLAAAAAYLTTMDGTELWSNKPDSRRRVASTIKLLNALVVLEHASLDDEVVVSGKAVKAVGEGGVGLVGGQSLTVRQLMTMMLVASANDAAEVLAFHVAGSESKFVEMMNAKAAELGLQNTHAIDPHGLSKRESSSAADLAVMARELMAYPAMRAIVNQKSVVVPGPNGSRSVYSSTDQLLGRYAGIEGVKTGFTNPAGYCFVGAAKRGETELLGVVLGAGSNAGRFTEMRKLLDWGFANYRTSKLVSAETPIGVVSVGRTGDSTVSVSAAESLTVLEKTGEEPATLRVTLPQRVPTSVWRGQQLGLAEVYRSGSVIASAPLLAEAAVSDPSAVSEVPPPKPVAAQPSSGVWERMKRSATRAAGMLSLRLLGTPLGPR